MKISKRLFQKTIFLHAFFLFVLIFENLYFTR